MDRKELIEAVKVEAANLRKYATKEELNRLDLQSFNPKEEHFCIYGQMTGSCWSARASNLIKSSAPVCLGEIQGGHKLEIKALNYTPDDWESYDGTCKDYTCRHWSPIESYIWDEDNSQKLQNKKLISYLKGETNELNLE